MATKTDYINSEIQPNPYGFRKQIVEFDLVVKYLLLHQLKINVNTLELNPFLSHPKCFGTIVMVHFERIALLSHQ